MNERAIKDLCIAWEALSRIPGGDAETLAMKVNSYANKLIEEAQNPLRERILPDNHEEIPF